MNKSSNSPKTVWSILFVVVVGVSAVVWKSKQGAKTPPAVESAEARGLSQVSHRSEIDSAEPLARSQVRQTGTSATNTRDEASIKSVTGVGKHLVSVRTRPNAKAYILERELTAPELAKVKTLGGRVAPSTSGRTASVLRFDTAEEARSDDQIRKVLTESKIGIQGQLLEFRMKVNPDHNHEHCGSCIATNQTTVSETQGVIAVPLYLGDPNFEQVDVVVNPSQVSSQDLITLLEVDHTQPQPQ